MTAVLGAVTGWLLYGALALALGAVFARWAILPRVRSAPADVTASLRIVAGRLGVGGGLLLPVAMGLVFLRQLLEFRDPFVPWPEDARLLLAGTAWGTTWLWGAAGSVMAGLGFLVATRGGPVPWGIASVVVLALGTFPAFTGHANAAGGLRALTLTGDTLHVWAAGGWVGGLAYVIHAERTWRTQTERDPRSLLPLLVPLFSPFAIVCVATLGATGAMAAVVHVHRVSALVTTAYGRLLSLKLLLVAAVAGLGFVNWRRLTPALGTPAGEGALRRSASLELLVAQGVLVATAILVRSPPPTP